MKRLQTLDGLRGVLALVVCAQHILVFLGHFELAWASQICVWAFFAMSGLVLSRAYDGGYLRFIARRAVRLWPVFAVCMLFGYAVIGQVPFVSSFFRFPLVYTLDGPIGTLPDPPVWSLYLEAWSVPFIPVIAWFSRGGPIRPALILPIWLVSICLGPVAFVCVFFLIGAAMARLPLRSPVLERTLPQWLGKISYSLYLSHWPVLMLGHKLFGDWGLAAGAVAALPIAWVIWWAVERPSITLSRRVGHLHMGHFMHRPAAAVPTRAKP